MTQVTIKPSYYKKMDLIKGRIKHAVFTKSEEIVSYAVAISPVDTGAYVESFSVTSRGSRSGRSRSSNGRRKLSLGEKEGVKMDQASRLRAELEAIDPLETNGFTLTNNSPHSYLVEDKHGVFLRTKDRFR